jgi:hypothetical protein
MNSGSLRNKVVVAVACEFVGFFWATMAIEDAAA